MELKDYKRRMNLPERKAGLPRYNDGLHKFKSSDADWGGAVTGAIGFGGSIYKSFGPVKSTSDLIAESGTSIGSGTGFTYTKINGIDK